MKRKVFACFLSALFCVLAMFNGGMTASAANGSKDAQALLDALYEELGFDEADIEQLSRSSIPAERYFYVSATNLPISNQISDTLTITMNYNSSNFSYWTHSDESVVSSYSVSDSVVNSYVNTFTGTFTLSSSQTISYTGPITSIRLRASVIGNSLHSYTAPTPTISNLLIGAMDFTSIASAYINISSRIPGDVDCNGYVNDTDVNLLSRYLAEDPTAYISPEGLISADVNRNGYVTIDDLSIIAQVLNGSLSHF